MVLKAAGVLLVFASSFGDIFKWNAINHRLVYLEAPELVAGHTQKIKPKVLTNSMESPRWTRGFGLASA